LRFKILIVVVFPDSDQPSHRLDSKDRKADPEEKAAADDVKRVAPTHSHILAKQFIGEKLQGAADIKA
jgi:hypothetical protein